MRPASTPTTRAGAASRRRASDEAVRRGAARARARSRSIDRRGRAGRAARARAPALGRGRAAGRDRVGRHARAAVRGARRARRRLGDRGHDRERRHDPRARPAVRSAAPRGTRGRAASCTACGARRSGSRASSAITRVAVADAGAEGEALVIAAPTKRVRAAGQRARALGRVRAGLRARDRRRAGRPAISRRCASCSMRCERRGGALRRDAADPRGVSRRAVRVLARTRRRAGCTGTSCISISRALAAAAPRRAPPIVAGPLIDYRAQYRWRRAALDRVRASGCSATRGAEIDAWAREHGAYDYAAFRAFGEAQRTGWRSWPQPHARRRADDRARRDAGDRARRRCRARRQPRRRAVGDADAARARSRPGRCSLYLDLPVGVNCDAYEVWRWRAAVPARSRRRRAARCAVPRRPELGPAAAVADRAAPRSLSLLHPVRAPSHERRRHAAHRSRDGPVPAVLRARRAGPPPTACTSAIASEELLAIITLESVARDVRGRRRGSRHRARRTCGPR